MNDKTKRIILITACCLLCGVAVIGIAGRFGGNTVTPSGTVSGSQPDSNDPNVNINNSQGDVNVPSLTPEQSDPGQGANSNGTEQTIQANPVKPDAPEKPESPSGTATLPDDHKAEDVPTSERKTEDEPHPTYPEQPTSKPAESQPAAGSTNSSGQVYVPGFGYVDSSGDNTVIDGQDIYENGNKIGEMAAGTNSTPNQHGAVRNGCAFSFSESLKGGIHEATSRTFSFPCAHAGCGCSGLCHR